MSVAPRARIRSRLSSRVGVFVFLFFLVKGLAWLVIPAAAAYFATR
ncbi:MAG: hypothetical protein JNK53_00750 [Phycisphaerae bacterium]|nr:hypothetical protein [Phycisphaerae bacterium]